MTQGDTMTDETLVLAEALYAVSLAHDWENTVDREDRSGEIVDEVRARGYSLVPTATLERARRIEAEARKHIRILNADTLDALRAALSDGGES